MKYYYERLHCRDWNTIPIEDDKTILFLPEKEIERKSYDAFCGANWEIIVVPQKYETEHNVIVEFGIKIAKMRGGRVIYI